LSIKNLISIVDCISYRSRYLDANRLLLGYGKLSYGVIHVCDIWGQ
jgi:hypothetical protein